MKSKKLFISLMVAALLIALLPVSALAAPQVTGYSSDGGFSQITVAYDSAQSTLLSSGNFLVKENGNCVGVVKATPGNGGASYTLSLNQPLHAGSTYTVSFTTGDGKASITIPGQAVGIVKGQAMPKTSDATDSMAYQLFAVLAAVSGVAAIFAVKKSVKAK